MFYILLNSNLFRKASSMSFGFSTQAPRYLRRSDRACICNAMPPSSAWLSPAGLRRQNEARTFRQTRPVHLLGQFGQRMTRIDDSIQLDFKQVHLRVTLDSLWFHFCKVSFLFRRILANYTTLFMLNSNESKYLNRISDRLYYTFK